MLPLGFRFEVDAVILGGMAHRQGCPELELSAPLVSVAAGESYRSDRSPAMSALPTAVRGLVFTYQLERV